MVWRTALWLIALAACDEHGTSVLPDAPRPVGTLSAIPGMIDFGSVALGSSSTTAAVTIVAEGDVAVDVSHTIAGADANRFFIVASTCTTLMPPSDTCMIELRFTPMMVGPSASTLVISSGSHEVEVALTGRATASSSLVMAPSVHDYGIVSIGTTSATTFTLTNATGGRASQLSVTLVGADAAEFSKATDTCQGADLPSGGSCSVVVAFSPTGVGAKVATLQVAGAGGFTTASLLGTGTATTALTITPAVFDFGAVGQGNSGFGKMFTITNTGGSATGSLVTAMGGNHPGDFIKQFDQCNNRVLAPGASCTLFVTFEPGPVGMRSARVQVSAAPGGSTAADVSGTCTP